MKWLKRILIVLAVLPVIALALPFFIMEHGSYCFTQLKIAAGALVADGYI